MSGFLDNLENSWSSDFEFESKPMADTDAMGREKIISETSEIKLTPEQAQAILIFQIEQKIRNRIALQVESKFHGMYHDASHVIGNFIRNMA
jgi:hypothetical protein